MAQWAEIRNGARAIAFLSWRRFVNKTRRQARQQRGVSGLVAIVALAQVCGLIYLFAARSFDPVQVVFDPSVLEGFQKGGFIVGVFLTGGFLAACLTNGGCFTREDADVLFPTPVPNAVLLGWKMAWAWSALAVALVCAWPTWHGRPVWFMGGLIDPSLVALVRDSVLSLLLFATVAVPWAWGIGLALQSDENRLSGLRKSTMTLSIVLMALASGALFGSVDGPPWRWAAEFLDQPWIHALFWPVDLFVRLATHGSMGYGRFALADLAAVLLLQFGGLWTAFAMRDHVCHVSARNLLAVPLGTSHVEETTGKPEKRGWLWRRRREFAETTVRGLDAVWWRHQVQAFGLTRWGWLAKLLLVILAPAVATGFSGRGIGVLTGILVVPFVLVTGRSTLTQTAHLAKSLPFDLRSLLAMELKIAVLPMTVIMEVGNVVHFLLGTHSLPAALTVAVMVIPVLLLHATVGLYAELSDVKPAEANLTSLFVRLFAHAVWIAVILFTGSVWKWPLVASVPVAVMYCLAVSALAWRGALRQFEDYCPVEFSVD